MHTSIIIISNEPALGINEPLSIGPDQGLKRTQPKIKCEAASLSFSCSPNAPDPHPAPSEAIDQLLRAKVTSPFSPASPRTKPGSV